MTVERIATSAGLPLSDLTIAVVGVGRMGANVARAFHGRVKELVLIDINEGNLRKVTDELQLCGISNNVSIVHYKAGDPGFVREALARCHVGIFATSSFRNLLRIRDIPSGFVAIDDSRPEALPRDPKSERIILEGGLLRIRGARVDYDFGFGQDDNVFGCLGEAFLLALDGGKVLKPTLAGVDMENFYRMLAFSRASGVCEGDLKSSEVSVSEGDIRHAFEKRGLLKARWKGEMSSEPSVS